MLFRISAISAALGILAIIAILLSAIQGVPVGTDQISTEEYEILGEGSSAQVDGIVVRSSRYSTLRIGDLPFAANLINPCPSDPPAGRSGTIVDEDKRADFAVEFYRTISDSSGRYYKDAEDMLKQNLIHECALLNIPILQNTPTLEELEGMSPSDALMTIYASVLRHTAHAYFIRYQHQTYVNVSCSDVIDNEATVSRNAGEMAVKQKFLACIMRMGATAMGYPHNYNDIVEQVLQEQLTDLRSCSRRALRDCQVLRSIIHLLDVVSKYTAREVAYES